MLTESGDIIMRMKLIRAAWVIALAAGAGQPSTSWAIVSVSATPYVASIENGGYDVTDPPYFGTIDYLGNPTDLVTAADIFLPSASLEFNTAVNGIHSQNVSGGELNLDLVDTTGQYELILVIDDAADLFNGNDGATVDSNSQLVTFPGDDILGGNFTGDLAIPAPAALPVFASALGLLGIFGRRRKRPAVAA
jgi:hypothetical protein